MIIVFVVCSIVCVALPLAAAYFIGRADGLRKARAVIRDLMEEDAGKRLGARP